MSFLRALPTVCPPSLFRYAPIAMLVALSCLACSKQDDHDEHDHAHGEEGHAEEAGEPALKTDAHHVEEGRQDCQDDVALPDGALERYGIQVAPASAVALVPTVSAPGHIAFPQGALARVGSAVAGRVVETRVRSGDTVSKGDMLLTVESSILGEAQSDYLQSRTMASTAGPSVELASSALERAKELFDRVQGVAMAEVKRREGELRQAERDRDIALSAQAAAMNRLLLLGMSEASIRVLESSGKVQPRFEIVAPISGRVVEMTATTGELVGPEKDRLLVIGDVSTLWAIAEVSESRLAEIAIGARARVRVPALQGARREGKVSAVPVVLEASTRTAEVRVELPNPDGAMLPGMFIQVEIDSSVGAHGPTLAIPDEAVMTVEGKPSVFVPLEPGSSIFCKHEVQVGAPIGTHLPVLSGLEAGTLVVVAGTFRLKAELGKASAQHEH